MKLKITYSCAGKSSQTIAMHITEKTAKAIVKGRLALAVSQGYLAHKISKASWYFHIPDGKAGVLKITKMR